MNISFIGTGHYLPEIIQSNSQFEESEFIDENGKAFEAEIAKLDTAQANLNERFGITAKSIEEYSRNLIAVARNSAISREQHELVIRKLAVADKQYEELTGSSMGFVRAMGQQASNTGLAGATLTEFGRTISDANYGIRGIANNLSQLSSLFITLVAKQKESRCSPICTQCFRTYWGDL